MPDEIAPASLDGYGFAPGSHDGPCAVTPVPEPAGDGSGTDQAGTGTVLGTTVLDPVPGTGAGTEAGTSPVPGTGLVPADLGVEPIGKLEQCQRFIGHIAGLTAAWIDALLDAEERARQNPNGFWATVRYVHNRGWRKIVPARLSPGVTKTLTRGLDVFNYTFFAFVLPLGGIVCFTWSGIRRPWPGIIVVPLLILLIIRVF
jgi:hypothetical protein